jgi:hypothetical protein
MFAYSHTNILSRLESVLRVHFEYLPFPFLADVVLIKRNCVSVCKDSLIARS